MNIPTREHAAALGLAAVWDDAHRLGIETPIEPSIPETIGGKVFADFDSKLEWQFWQRLWAAKEAGLFSEVDAHCVKVRAIGDASWFTVDFIVLHHQGQRTVYETKGYLREKDKLRLIGAASRYPEWAWVIAMRINRKWECRYVTGAGISRTIWTPDWLK